MKKIKKRVLIGIGSIIIIYLFISIIFPRYIGVPLAAYQSRKVWIEHEQEQKLHLEAKSNSNTKFPKPIGYVNDFENVFTSEQLIKLNKRISAYELETTNEIAIVTINSIKPYENINEYATDLSIEWGIGKIEKNNGLLIIFSKSLQKILISTGLGTERVLTDKICKNILDKIVIPEFKNDDYYIGIEKGLTELIKIWE